MAMKKPLVGKGDTAFQSNNKSSKKQNDSMNILAAVNENYLKPLSVTLYSAAVHNPVLLNVFILHFGIPENARKEFKERVRRYGRPIQVKFIKIDRKELDRTQGSLCGKALPYRQYGAEAVARLFLLKVLPPDIDRILWLDADIIVRGDIRKLYTYADQGQCAVVCEDMFPKWEKYELLSGLGLKMTDKYFNSGVMLFYLKNVRAQFAEDTFFQWMSENPDKLRYPDQNVLNICFKNKLRWVNPRIYNLQLLRVNYGMRKDGFMKQSRVIHYNTLEKPWNDNYSGECEGEFWKYGIPVLGIKEFLYHYVKKLFLKKRK